jgi:hypothetical protein
MRILARFPALTIFAALGVSSPLLAQAAANPTLNSEQNPSSLGARQIVELSVAATERNWYARDHYTFTERDDDRRLDSHGSLKSEDASVTQMIVVNGAHLQQIVEHNGRPPSAAEQKKALEDLDKLQHETPEQRSLRLRNEEENKSFLREILNAFDFQLVGEESVDGRQAYVLQATPHPGYQATGKYGKMFSKVAGRLWVDKQDFGWIKVDGEVTQSFSMGLFVARVQRGSHILLNESCVGDGVWVPARIEVRASARILFVKSLDIDRILTYSNYVLAPGTAFTAVK